MKAASPRIKSAFSWPGAKARLEKELLPLIPEDAVCWCEVFAGTARMTLAKERHKVEVINDASADIVALMRNAHFHLPALLEEMRWFIASRKDLHDFRAQPGLTEIQRAARFLLRHRVSFGGQGSSFGVSKLSSVGFKREEMAVRLEDIRRRLDGVVIENLPYEQCLANYDAPTTFFFLDPPYVGESTKAYDGWEQKDMVQLRGRMDRLKGRFLLTVNDSPENRRLFSDLNVRSVSSRNQLRNVRTSGGAKFSELIITSK